MKTAIITGGSSGIGLAAAKQLAEKGYNLLLAARTQSKLDSAKCDIEAAYPDVDVQTYSIDLSDFQAVRGFANYIKTTYSIIDVLALNAGSYSGARYFMGTGGYEMMMSTTHLGHFLLTHHVLGLLKHAEQPRIVVTSSIAHRIASLDIDSFAQPKYSQIPYLGTLWGYGQSKLANILFVRRLAQELANTAVKVNCFHPGGVDTGIFDRLPNLITKTFQLFLITPKQAAKTLIYLATDANLPETGKYFSKGKVDKITKAASSKSNADTLWQESERILAEYL